MKIDTTHQPLQYRLGEWDYYGAPRPLVMRPGVFIPRPETERLVEVVLTGRLAGLDPAQAASVCDLGTGSGYLAIALAASAPRWQGVAVDAAPEAVVLARENAAQCGVADRVTCVRWDAWQSPRPEWLARFDLVVSNPPYIPTEELTGLPPQVQHEPRLALDGGADGLVMMRRVIPLGAQFLRSGGWLAVEMGEGQRDRVVALFAGAGYHAIEVHADLAGRPRIVVGRHG